MVAAPRARVTEVAARLRVLIVLVILSALATTANILFAWQLGVLANPGLADGVNYVLYTRTTDFSPSQSAPERSNPLSGEQEGEPTRTLAPVLTPVGSVLTALQQLTPLWHGALVLSQVTLGWGDWQPYTARFWPTLILLVTVFFTVRRGGSTSVAWAAVLLTVMLPCVSVGARAAGYEYFVSGVVHFDVEWFLDDLRPDFLFAVLLMASLTLFFRWQAQPGLTRAATTGFVLALDILVKPSVFTIALVALSVALVYVWLVDGRRIPPWKQLLVALTAFVVALLPWFSVGGLNLALWYIFDVILPKDQDATQYWSSGGLLPGLDFAYYWRYFDSLMGFEGWIVLAVAAVLAVRRRRTDRDADKEALGYATVGLAIWLYISLVPAKNWFAGAHFYLLLWLWAWCTISAATCAASRSRSFRRRAPRGSQAAWLQERWSLGPLLVGLAAVLAVVRLGGGWYAVQAWPEYGRQVGPANVRAMGQAAADLTRVARGREAFVAPGVWASGASMLLTQPVETVPIWPQGLTPPHIWHPELPPDESVEKQFREYVECRALILLDMESIGTAPHVSAFPVTRPYYDALRRFAQEPSSPYVFARAYPLAADTFTTLLTSGDGKYAPSLELWVRDDGRGLPALGFSGPRDGILFGHGWSDPELRRGARIRWAGAQSELLLSPSDQRRLTLELEPNAAFQGRAVQVNILDDVGTVVHQVVLRDRTLVTFDVPGDPGTRRRLRLRIDDPDGGVPGDAAQRKYHVRRYGWGDARSLGDTPTYDAGLLAQLTKNPDIAPGARQRAASSNGLPTDGLFVGSGWYPLEAFGGQTFRWLDTNGEVVITSPSRPTGRLSLDLEPGPGLAGRPARIRIFDGQANLVGTVDAQGRQTVDVHLETPSDGVPAVFRLAVEDGGRHALGDDPRTLNVRVFSMRWEPGVAARGPNLAPTPPLVTPPLAAPPSDIGEYGSGAGNPALRQSGILSDGWVASLTSVELTQAPGQGVLSVRGLVPQIGDPAFATELTVLVDGDEVANQTLALGYFALAVPVSRGPGHRRVEVRFSRVQQLPGGDGRMAGARLRFLGFER